MRGDGDGPAVHDPQPRRARVVEALEATRLAMRKYRRAVGLARVALAELALAALVVLADWSWVLPAAARAAGLAGMVGLAVYGLIRWVVRPGSVYGKGDAAAEVESHFPKLGQRLRTTLEYSEPTPGTMPAAPGLVRALTLDTDRRTRSLPFGVVVPWSRFERRAVGLALLGMTGLVAALVSPGLRTATGRLFLMPLHYTGLDVKPGDQTLKVGDDFRMTATLSGRPVKSAVWSRREVGDEAWTEVSLAPPSSPGERPLPLIGSLSAALKAPRGDFEYRVVAGEVESPVYRVRVLHPLKLRGIEAAINPPPYTKRPAVVAKRGDFQVVEGSEVRLKVTLDRTPAKAEVTLATGEDLAKRINVPLEIDGDTLTADLPPLAEDARYEIVASAADGMRLDPETYRIEVQPDEKPTIRFVRPPESFAALPTTDVPIQVEAGDDFGVARVGITFRVNEGEEETLYLNEPEGQPAEVEALATLFLERYDLNYTDSLTYYAFVEDNKPPRPNRVVTDLRFLDILPYKQEYQLVEGGGGASSGASVTLEELIARQRVNLNRTFAHVEDRPVAGEVARRLTRFEDELAGATAEFAEGLERIAGPVPILHNAIDAMQEASALLERKDVQAAKPEEELALSSLIAARRNLRKLLSPRSGTFGACRQFDRQQEQKIRRPPPDKTNEELAKLEEDLDELAREERAFSEEIEAKGGGGPKLDPAERQEKAAKEAERLRDLARRDEALSDLARRRMAEVAEAVKAANESLKSGRDRDAAEQAREAAEASERLARQVGALKARELAAKLARARDLSQRLAGEEKGLGEAIKGEAREGGPDREKAEKQAGLAEEAGTLDDLLRRLETDAAEESRELGQAIGRAAGANRPSEIADLMRQAASGLAAGRQEQAGRDAVDAAKKLEALALDLESARRSLVQPRLDRLMAAENQAAEALKAIGTVKNEGQKAAAEKAMSDLARTLEMLSPGDGPLAEVAEAVRGATQQLGGGNHWTTPSDHVEVKAPGFYTPPELYPSSVRRAIVALQAQIQELILNDALVDRDGAVPPRYKEMVEDYYRVLSQDLR